MKLTTEEQEMLNSKYGKAAKKSMEIFWKISRILLFFKL